MLYIGNVGFGKIMVQLSLELKAHEKKKSLKQKGFLEIFYNALFSERLK